LGGKEVGGLQEIQWPNNQVTSNQVAEKLDWKGLITECIPST
jgi:hypothetical protein